MHARDPLLFAFGGGGVALGLVALEAQLVRVMDDDHPDMISVLS